jgi:hypothetical protein
MMPKEPDMVAMQTHIDPAFAEAGLREQVLDAAEYLQNQVGRSAVNPKAEWKLVRTLRGEPTAHVTVSDDGAEVQRTFSTSDLSDWYAMKQHIHSLWFDLLHQRFDIYGSRYRELTASASEE